MTHLSEARPVVFKLSLKQTQQKPAPDPGVFPDHI